MYLYFDTQGNLKEQINDQALRQGNSNINKLYVYWEKSEDNANITGLWARFKADDGTYNPSSSTWIQSNTYVEQTIPYDKNRDLKFFNYFKEYKFYTIDLPDAVLGQSGAWLGTLQFVETNSITTLGQLAFYVSESNASVEADENINIAQWNYLIALVSNTINSIPTKTSDLTNDSGFITSEDLSDDYVTTTELETTLEGYAQESDIPTKVSDLTNDSGYQTASQVQTAINNKLTNVYKFVGSITVADLNEFIVERTDPISELNGYVYNITNSGNLNNYTGTTSVVAGDNVAFVYISDTNWLWDKLAGTSDLSAYALKSELPTKTSDLTNDSGFITSNESGNNYTIAYNLVVNNNGYQFTGYKFADVTLQAYPNNEIKQFQVSTSSVVVTDLSVIKSYLQTITGHDRIPTYDEDRPINEFIICSSNDTMWKLQYDSTNGLLAFKVGSTPAVFSAKDVAYLTTAPSSDNNSGKLKFVVLSSEPSTYYDGYYYIITAPQVTLISFTIGNTSYQAESGMKWSEWCNSAYNNTGDGWHIATANNGVWNDAMTTYVTYDGSGVLGSEEIVADRAYTATIGGGGNN